MRADARPPCASSLGALLYLDLRRLVRGAEQIARHPGRGLPWLLMLCAYGAVWLVRLHSPHAAPPLPLAPQIGPLWEGLRPAAATVVLGLALGQAARSPGVRFDVPADGTLLPALPLCPRAVAVWAFVRGGAHSVARALSMVAGIGYVLLLVGDLRPVTVLRDLAGAAAYYAFIRAAWLPVHRLGRRLAPLPWIARAVVAAGAVAAAAALLAARGAGDFGTRIAAHPALALPPATWGAAAAGGSPTALLILLALTCAFGAWSVALAGDLYPEMHADSQLPFRLRGRLLQGGRGAAAPVPPPGRETRRARSAAGSWRAPVPGGAWTLVWKEWLAVLRGRGGLGGRAALLAAAAGAGIAVGRLAHAVPLAPIVSSAFTYSALFAPMGGMRLAVDLRKPLWWLSADPLEARLAATLLWAAAWPALFWAAGLVPFLVVRGAPPALVAASAGGLLAVQAVARTAALLGVVLFPSAVDRRGPGAMLASGLVFACLLVPVAVGAVVGLGVLHSPPAAVGVAAALALGEAVFLMLATTDLVRGRGLAIEDVRPGSFGL